MFREDFNKHLSELLSKLSDTLMKKGADYASKNEVFSNFQQAANIANITINQSLMNMIGVKIARLSNLMPKGQGQVPNFESVNDTILDMMGYSALLYISLLEYRGLLKNLKENEGGPFSNLIKEYIQDKGMAVEEQAPLPGGVRIQPISGFMVNTTISTHIPLEENDENEPDIPAKVGGLHTNQNN